MDDVAGGGTVLSLAEQEFGVIAELLDQALAMLEEGIATLDESFVHDRENYFIRIDEAHAHPGRQRDQDVTARRGISAFDLSENLD
ncbi:MAG: hypothetical protein ACRDRI_11625 [Pseudonocardiaceae bacterium]